MQYRYVDVSILVVLTFVRTKEVNIMAVENAMVPVKETSTDTSDVFIQQLNPEPGLTTGQKAFLIGAGVVGAVGVGCIGYTIYNNYKMTHPYPQYPNLGMGMVAGNMPLAPQMMPQQPMTPYANDPRNMTPNQVAAQITAANKPGYQPIPTPEEQIHAYYQQQMAGLVAQNQQLMNDNNQLATANQQMDGIIKQQAAQNQQANAEINRLNSIIYAPQQVMQPHPNPALDMPGAGMIPPQQ